MCIEFEVPDNKALLSDFDSWCIILNNGFLTDSLEEAEQLETYYDSLSPIAQKELLEQNWVHVFDVFPSSTAWRRQGEWVQATVWELRKEMVRGVRFFKTALRKSDG